MTRNQNNSTAGYEGSKSRSEQSPPSFTGEGLGPLPAASQPSVPGDTTANSAARRPTPAAYIDAALRAVLPDGVPPSYRLIEGACWDGYGRHRKAVGRLQMFDGLPATVEVREAGPCTSHRFTDMPGGACSYEGGQWVRVTEGAA